MISSVLLFTEFINENRQWKFHELKKKTLQYLRKYNNHPCIKLSQDIIQNEKLWMNSFICFGIHLKKEGNTFQYNADKIPDVFKAFKTYPEMLTNFYNDTKLYNFWDDTKPLWDKVYKEFDSTLSTKGLLSFIKLFYGDINARLILVPEPLIPPSFGFGPTDGKRMYSICGPLAIPKESEEEVHFTKDNNDFLYLMFHEFSHPLLYKAISKYSDIKIRTKNLQKTMNYKGYFKDKYTDWDIIFDEIFIRAATVIFCEYKEGKKQAEKMLSNEKNKYGIVLIDKMVDSLKEYLTYRMVNKYNNLVEFLPILTAELLQ